MCTLILYSLGLKQYLPCQWIQKSSFLEQIMWNSPEIIHSETWAWSWSWTWKAYGRINTTLHGKLVQCYMFLFINKIWKQQ